MKKILIFGGRSEERLVSVASAQNLAKNFHFDDLLFLAFSGAVHRMSLQELQSVKNPFKESVQPQNPPIAASIFEMAKELSGQVVFIGLHGTEGEDGTLQKFFENSNIHYTGSNSQSSRVCFEKNLAKDSLRKNGAKVAEQVIWNETDKANLLSLLSPFLQKHGKIVLKPVANGSSVGLHIVETEAQLQVAVKAIQQSSYAYMAECFIKGRELTVGVIDWEGRLRALPPSEVVLNQGRTFDYDGKYLGLGTTEITPAEISDLQRKWAQDLAIKAHQVLGCAGYSRTDMILLNDSVLFLETNTLPGMTKASFIPQQLQCEGIEVKKFIESQINLAAK